jgi:HAD superfamily hydrolase (TIGR01490 family)
MLHPPRVAFFDVDETLITGKSMFSFLEYFLRYHGHPDAEYQRVVRTLREMSEAGIPRAETNRIYYGVYAGYPVPDVARLGDRWFDRQLAGGGFFRPEVVAELRRHSRAGTSTVAVSGSFPPCVEPIARHLGVSQVLCTRPTQAEGHYTGAVDTPMIGEAKAVAVRAVMADLGADPVHCTAYGDHSSDLPMLTAVGEPVVVGRDPELLAHAATQGWRQLIPGPDEAMTDQV